MKGAAVEVLVGQLPAGAAVPVEPLLVVAVAVAVVEVELRQQVNISMQSEE